MNARERQMAEILQRGAEEFGFVSVKAEFEAEGSRLDDVLRLNDIGRRAGLPLTLKIGGCEAIWDLLQAKQIGVRYVVAPMIESPFALGKYIGAKDAIFDEVEEEETDFLFNLETIAGFEHLDAMIDAATSVGRGARGIVFGRGDFVNSLGLDRELVNAPEVRAYVLGAARKAHAAGLDYVLGGRVSTDSVDMLREVASIHLTRFETRKVVFDADESRFDTMAEGIQEALRFELLWLQNKREHYRRISVEDQSRIDLLESRFA